MESYIIASTKIYIRFTLFILLFIVDGEWTETIRGQNISHFDEPSGPRFCATFKSPTASALEFFYKMFNESFFKHIVRETNLHAQMCIQASASGQDANWKDTDEEEMKVYFGVLMYMGISPRPQ